MSYTPSITNELIRDKSLKANTKILLLVLMTYENKEGSAYNCINLGRVSGYKAGGIIGTPSDRTFTIKNCYSGGNISGTNAGTIVGWHNWNPTAAEAINCYYSTSEKVTNYCNNK